MRKDYKISYYVFLTGIIFGIAACFVNIFVGVIMIMASVAQASVFYRCPYCRCLLLDVRGIPNFCHNCGEELS